MFGLPTTATAPFCPAEIVGTIAIPEGDPFWKKIFRSAGPGLLVSVGYMDPGNWATGIQAGAQFGYALLFVVLLSSLAAIVLQCLAMRLGIASGRDLATHCREQYGPLTGKLLWLFAEISIIACDLAEVLGSALAFKLLLGVSLPVGVLLTAFDTLIVLGLKGRGFRQVEAIILGLILTIGVCLVAELLFIKPDWQAVVAGLAPSMSALSAREPLYLAIGILGATVMPHNLYLHSAVVQTRVVADSNPARSQAIVLARIDTIVSLLLALCINGAILILAAAAFHGTAAGKAVGIDDAYHLLDPVAGSTVAGVLFGIALLAAGQSSTFTGTIAGQVIMDGFLALRLPCWQRRLITRGLALGPALFGVITLGEHSVGRLLVLSQVVLSLQLPFAMYPLIRLTGQRAVMGNFANTWVTSLMAWSLFGVIATANIWLCLQVAGIF